MPITALYAGLLAPIFVFLSIRVITTRRGAKVALGHGDNGALLRAIRVHGNFAEYVPLTLIMMALAESLALPALLVHAVGVTLVTGRLIHAFGVSRTPENFTLRVTGMSLTFTCLLVLALACIYGSLAKSGAAISLL